MRQVLIAACWLLFPTGFCLAQFPNSVICKFEKIAIVEVNEDGKILVGSEGSSGDLVISDLNSDAPLGTGNVSTIRLKVLKRSKDTIWLAEDSSDASVVIMTLFFKTGIIMHTKHELRHEVSDGEKPFGFVEIGRFKTLK